jgi:hypothetical protein
MTDILDQVRRIGWLAVEAALLIVILCVLLNIILGSESGSFVSSVAANATSFVQGLPAGALLGLVLIILVYWFVTTRVSR